MLLTRRSPPRARRQVLHVMSTAESSHLGLGADSGEAARRAAFCESVCQRRRNGRRLRHVCPGVFRATTIELAAKIDSLHIAQMLFDQRLAAPSRFRPDKLELVGATKPEES